MKRYKTITMDNYKVFTGDLIIIAENKSNAIVDILNKAETFSAIVFNCNSENIQQEGEALRYIDKNESANIDYIESKCRELFAEDSYVSILINNLDVNLKENKNAGKRLKTLARELGTTVIVETMVNGIETKEYPELKDIECKEIAKEADIIMYLDESLLLKNTHGKVGIVVCNEEDEQ